MIKVTLQAVLDNVARKLRWYDYTCLTSELHNVLMSEFQLFVQLPS